MAPLFSFFVHERRNRDYMIKKTITFTDFNDVERTEDFYFNLTKAEIMEMEMEVTGGFTQLIQKAVASQDFKTLVSVFKDLILRSYGEKSADGRRFVKSQRLREEFEQTEAYSILFMELATDTDKASEFVNGIAPAEAREQLKKQQLEQLTSK